MHPYRKLIVGVMVVGLAAVPLAACSSGGQAESTKPASQTQAASPSPTAAETPAAGVAEKGSGESAAEQISFLVDDATSGTWAMLGLEAEFSAGLQVTQGDVVSYFTDDPLTAAIHRVDAIEPTDLAMTEWLLDSANTSADAIADTLAIEEVTDAASDVGWPAYLVSFSEPESDGESRYVYGTFVFAEKVTFCITLDAVYEDPGFKDIAEEVIGELMFGDLETLIAEQEADVEFLDLGRGYWAFMDLPVLEEAEVSSYNGYVGWSGELDSELWVASMRGESIPDTQEAAEQFAVDYAGNLVQGVTEGDLVLEVDEDLSEQVGYSTHMGNVELADTSAAIIVIVTEEAGILLTLEVVNEAIDKHEELINQAAASLRVVEL